MIFKKPIVITHDTIPYRWDTFSHNKYNNWIKMTRNDCDISDFTVDGFPYMLQIEPTNYCNLLCPFCPSGRNELGRERRHMNLDEFKSIIDNMKDYLFLLVLWGWGEPFMNPEFPDMIEYANSRDIKTVTSTNGQFFYDNEYCERILKSGLTTLIVAIDSLDEEKYNAFRRGGNLNKALEGLKSFVDMKKKLNSKTHINMRMVITRHNEDEIGIMRNKAKSLGLDRFSVKTVNPNPGTDLGDDMEIIPINSKYRRYKYRRGTNLRIHREAKCTWPWNTCSIYSNGDVVPCCYYFDEQMIAGNVFQQRLIDIWNGPAFRDLRKKIYFEKSSIDRCRECDINFQPSSTGWFVESVEFGAGGKRSQDNIITSYGKKILRTIR